MGVQGLWELLSPVGRPVTLESLENKILAVDVSIWLNQAIKGIRDKKGGSVQHAHLLGVFHKLCKLLFYKIKPVFVFDGSVPLLKKQTLLARQTQRQAAANNAKKASHNILKNYIIRSLKNQPNAGIGESSGLHDQIQDTAVSDVYSASNNLYCTSSIKGNAIPDAEIDSDIESENDEDVNYMYNDYILKNFQNPSSIDFDTEAFKSLPLDVQHELLNTIKETHKRRYWIHKEEMPEEYQTFSHYQMNRLLHRRKIQKRLEEIEKDISSKNTASLDSVYMSYMNMESGTVEANKVMSEDSSHFIFVKHQSKNSDKSEQTETSSLGSEKVIEGEVVQTSIIPPLPSPVAKNIGTQETVSERNINCIFSDEDQNCVITEVNLQGNKEATDKNPEQKSSINLADHPHSSPVTSSNFTSQIETSNSALLSTISSISTDIAESSELCVKGTKEAKDSNDDESSCKSRLAAHEAKDVISVFAECEKVENEFVERKDASTCNDTDICSLHHEVHTDDKECVMSTGNKSEENPGSAGLNLTLQESDEDELLPVEELETVEENLNERDKEINYYLPEAQDNVSLMEEFETLNREKQAQERRALTIAEHMYEETKELLKLFGVPYINSPTEAEAQCAKLDMLNLTNGTITDDSDIWLFGGQYVYKNFFSKNKYVEFFKLTDIQSHFNLDRQKLIALAMLTGSDYTQGVQGIGPVTAMEILSEFPGDGIKHLQNFKKWWSDFQVNKERPKNAVCEKLSKFHLDDGFPSEVVYDAYLHPTVDESMEHFSWGHPDLDQLREFAQEKFGWDQKKVDDILLPVLKKLNENQLQMRIDSFFHVKLKRQENPLSSKRLNNAIKKMHSHGSSTVIRNEDSNKAQKRQRRQRKQNKRQIAACSSKGTSKLNLSEESSSDS